MAEILPKARNKRKNQERKTLNSKIAERRKPTRHALEIGKLASLELTLAQYEITPNAETLRKVAG